MFTRCSSEAITVAETGRGWAASGHRIAGVSIPRTRAAGPAAKSAANPAAGRHRRLGGSDLLAIAGLVVEAGVIEFFLRRLLNRPFYYDEASRAYEIALGGRFLAHLDTAAAPLALGWVGIETAARLVFGDTEAGLRAPMFAVLPLLAVATYLLARRWLGATASFCTAALLLANLWIVNYGLQLKSYSYEALFAVATLALYLLVQRTTWRQAQLLGLYAALGLTCVFSLPNLFVVAPLLALDLVRVLRARDQAVARIAGEAIAGAIALAHYVLFVRPQSGVASTGFFAVDYAPHGFTAFVRFTADGLASYVPSVITGVVGAANTPPSYVLPPVAHGLLAAGLVILLAAGVVAAARDAAGRALLVAVGGALLLELLGSALHRWPFGLMRANIFVLPLLYILAGMGAVWLARAIRGPQRADGAWPTAWWRAIGVVAAAVALIVTAAPAAVVTAKGFAESSVLQTEPPIFGQGVKAAVADARRVGAPDDLVIIRADRSPPDWYATPWLYYMTMYQGYPAQVARLPGIPARNTISVAYVTPGAVGRFLSAHPGSPAIFLLEFNLPGNGSGGGGFPRWAHQESLRTLRRFGYCAVSDIAYPITGHLTVLRADCPRA